jgi:hypothetical protein
MPVKTDVTPGNAQSLPVSSNAWKSLFIGGIWLESDKQITMVALRFLSLTGMVL